CPLLELTAGQSEPANRARIGCVWRAHSRTGAQNWLRPPLYDGHMLASGSAIDMNDTLFDFPCEFPLKVMGRQSNEFRSVVLGIVQKHTGPVDASRIEERPSKDGSYLSLTYTFEAQSREQLDALYRELTSC